MAFSIEAMVRYRVYKDIWNAALNGAMFIGVGAGPADRRLTDQCFYANAPPPLRARIVHGHTVCKCGTYRICLTKVHETATPLMLWRSLQ